MKKMAIKGLVALAAVVALCMFFSGTIKTISTAKVRLVTAKQGKLEEEIKLSGNLTFTQTEEVKLALASDQSVTIKRVRVAKGRKVAAGDVLFEAEVSGYDKEMESLRSDYETAQKELMELERKNGDVRLKRTEEIWVEAYDALAQSKDDLMNAQTQLEVAAKLADVTLTDGRLPEKEQDETLLEAQKAVDKALAENIDMINRVYNTGSMKAAAGAAVVLDVKDGSVLAASNYPSFDQNLYATQYSEYSADESLPLFNRALQGLYTPGSTFKPAVAVAALDSGLINQYSTVFCNGVYTFYKGYSPRCTRHGHSGNIDVVTAIKWSCNVFFYDVGRRLTSDVYDAYAYKLGLGQRTGVEVSEAVGHLTSKNDSNYMESLDVQAAIGQGNTVVTPIQLATYAATLANNGTRYRTHFVKAILDSNTGEVISETQPEVMDIIEGTGNTFELVRQGMRQVPSTITNSKISSYPIAIACKTGTPQRSETYAPGKHYLNAMMVAYLPADDPQIAIGITIEYGGYGARTGDLVVDIANAYFAMQDGTLNEDGTIGKQETAADSTPADQTAPAQTETGTDAAADTATDPAAGTTDAAQETAPAGQDALDN